MVVDILQNFLGAVIDVRKYDVRKYDVRKYDVRKYMVAVGQEGLVDDALTVGFDKALEDEFLEAQALRFKWLAGPVTADDAVGTRLAQTVGALVAQEGGDGVIPASGECYQCFDPRVNKDF